jgi:hypothetical protein
MPIPEEFIEDAKRLGYGQGGWDRLDAEWDRMERDVKKYAAERGITVKREGRRIWGFKGEDEYLLAAATHEGDDPMNLWAHAFQKIECYLVTA